MKKKNSALLLLGSLCLALVIALGAAPLLPNGQVMAAPARPQGASITALPLETCTLVGTTRTCELWSATGTLTLPTGAVLPVWGFADTEGAAAQVPGPQIIANVGETLEIIFHNDLPGETVSLTFPGQMGVLADLDGVPTGGTATYSFDLDAPGTFLYEAGMTPNGARQIAMGMYGPLVVRPEGLPGQAYDAAATAFDEEALVVLGAIDPSFNADPNNYDVQFFHPEYWLINGLAYPATAEIDVVAGNTLLLRYINATHETQGMGTLGLRQTVIGSDGYPVVPAYGVRTETIAAGETMDMLVSVPLNTTEGTKFAVYNTAHFLHNAGTRAANGNLAFGGMMTFINTVTGEPAWEAGPLASNVDVTPSPTTGAGGVTLTADISDVATGGRSVTGAEYFVDALGLPGSGTPITIATPGTSVSISVPISQAVLDTWESDYHMLYVRGQDDGGSWGVPGAAVLNLDRIGPDSVAMSLQPEPSNGSVPVLLRATGDDHGNGQNDVVAATYTIDGGAAVPMNLARIDNPITAMTATLTITDLGGLAEGLHPIAVTAEDFLGNLGVPGVITLTLDQTGPAASVLSLDPNFLDLTGAPPVTEIRLEAALTDNASAGAQSTLANAEGFIDTVGPDGSGFDLFPSDGLFDKVSENAYFDIPIANFLYLAQGDHTIYVHGLDAAGNWGPMGQGTVTIDRGAVDTEGPAVAALSITFNQVARAANVQIAGTVADPNLLSNVAGVEWFVDVDPGQGMGTPIPAVDGVFDTPTESVATSIDVSTWATGAYTFYVRALDSSGNWGPTASAVVQVQGRSFLYLPTILHP